MLPEINGSSTPNGTCLNYTNFAYANVGTLSTVGTSSRPNSIYVNPSTQSAVIKPAFNSANTFWPISFRYACITRTAETVLELPAPCDFNVTCTTFGTKAVHKKTFTFTPDHLITSTFNMGIFNVSFNIVTQCTFNLINGSLLGLFPGAPILKPLTILTIDDFSYYRETCRS